MPTAHPAECHLDAMLNDENEIQKEIDHKILNIMKPKKAERCECEECEIMRKEKSIIQEKKEKIHFKSIYTPKFDWKIGGIPLKNLTTSALATNISH